MHGKCQAGLLVADRQQDGLVGSLTHVQARHALAGLALALTGGQQSYAISRAIEPCESQILISAAGLLHSPSQAGKLPIEGAGLICLGPCDSRYIETFPLKLQVGIASTTLHD